MTTPWIDTIDLFAGGGGTSTGLAQACQELNQPVRLSAFNHWPRSVETHRVNHPWAQHHCVRVDHVDPRSYMKEGRLRLLVASPECTWHSNARGGRPINDQERVSAWSVLTWIEATRPESVLIENVPEFRNWGPLDDEGKPIKSKKGTIYNAFLKNLRAYGYRVDEAILCAADYGVPTTRERLFIIAHRGWRAVSWPTPSHQQNTEQSRLPHFEERLPWVPARRIIDWSLPTRSIYNRFTKTGKPEPLVEKTRARIASGLRKFCGLSLDASAPDGGLTLEPFLVVFRNNQGAWSLDLPAPTLTTSGANLGLVQPRLQPFVLPPEGVYRGNAARAIEVPMQTLTSRGGGHLVEPFLVKFHGDHAHRSGASRVYSLNEPIRTLDTQNRFGLAQPFLINYYGNGAALSLDDPLDTVTGNDRFALIEPTLLGAVNPDELFWLDIGFRMLATHELAAAMSFPRDYWFAGTQTDQKKQIGNAVPVGLARALCREILQ